MRWKIVTVALALSLAASLVGCKQQCYLTECDFDHYRKANLLPANLENDPTASIVPSTQDVPAPTTVLNPERQIRYVTLAEAIANALEHGTVGVQSPFFPGAITDLLVQFNGRFVVGSDHIRVLALDPAIAATDIEGSLAKFDARWVSSMTWNTTDRPVGTALDTFQAGPLLRDINIQNAAFTTGIIKPLPTGGVAGITFSTQYELSNLNQRVNPAYRPALTFSFEQPLLQGYGVEINQIRPTHPGSQLNPFNVGGRVEGVLITRLRFDEQRAEFERNVNFLLVNVEIAYWNLYGSYWTLYSREQALRQAYEAWKINKARYEAGRINIQDFAQTRQQYELFRGQRIAALGDVLEKERQLRGFMGLPIEDGCRLVPIDSPTLAPYNPDWSTALNEAIALRPELVLARQDLKVRQLELVNQKNLLLPDLRFTSTYDVNGIGTRLDGGNAGNNAFSSLAQNQYNNWSLGLRMDIPIGFRDAHSAVRLARLNLARSYAVLRDQEDKAQRYLAFQYRKIFETYEQIRAQRAQRLAAADQLEARFKEFLAGRGTLDILLEAQRFWADALKAEFDNIVAYNNTLASFEFAKGTIQQHNNVVISDGPLPECAQVRAVEHERQRALGLVARQHAHPIHHRPCCIGGDDLIRTAAEVGDELPSAGIPELPTSESPALPGLKDDLVKCLQPRTELPDIPSPRSTASPMKTAPSLRRPDAARPSLNEVLNDANDALERQ
jgi:outer membrane protein TolC